MFEITIIAFNCGNAGKYVNGPGISLVTFIKKLRKHNINVNIYSEISSNEIYVKSLDDISLITSIKRSDILLHWSGIGPKYSKILGLAQKYNKIIFIGPNVIDTVFFDKEKKYLSTIKFNKIFTVNQHLRYKISKEHKISLNNIDILQVGPDQDLWNPSGKDNGKILWKGNSKHFVKDINFGLELSKRMPQYNFDFLGYPEPYNYNSHIAKSKDYHLYISTSLSETMGITLLESWMSGIPSVTHPKIYLHGENYKTGIITNRDLDSYQQSIQEIMENVELHKDLKIGAIDYIENDFNISFKNFIKVYVNGS